MEKTNNDYYPESFYYYDHHSMKSQKWFLILNSILLFATVIGAFCTAYHFNGFSLFAYLIALILFLILNQYNLEKKWFNARSTAESLKTIAWRYLMCSEPFDNVNEQSKNELREYLKELVSGGQQIQRDEKWIMSSKNDEIRKLSTASRKVIYLQHRIDEQLRWYGNKKRLNHKFYIIYWVLGLFLQIIAIILVFNNWVNNEHIFELSIESFIVTSNAVFAWTQLKRNRELSVTYDVAYQEIKDIQKELENIDTDEQFSIFVKNSEAAFS